MDTSSTSTSGSSTTINETVRDKIVLDLKRKALECKQSNNKSGALEYLKKAREVQQLTSITSTSTTTTTTTTDKELIILYLKTLAVHYKTNGNIQDALDTLGQAKQLELEVEEKEVMSAKVLRALLSSKNKNKMKPFESPMAKMVRRKKNGKIMPKGKSSSKKKV